MDEHTYRPHSAASEDLSVVKSEARRTSPGDLANFICNMNKLRDIYIDSSLFRNPAWDVFLTIYIKRRESLRVTLASLSAGNRLSEAECMKAIEDLSDAGLVRVEDGVAGPGPKAIDLTGQGLQRMEAFLSSAERR
ncbi:hypothetical protein HFP57_09255 [Parasphingopyxis algicola]|uniref:hypothetical protein n=1 Tax=Parasphingopyxis algicola TaxID=2026624 RepID=UPI0015A1C865|nr:hypothetical protein [Parasphingopyxis algicola]QLC25192.1 hypothetical protein HFP57_09255 [Parasphingopyxis algicola]